MFRDYAGVIAFADNCDCYVKKGNIKGYWNFARRLLREVSPGKYSLGSAYKKVLLITKLVTKYILHLWLQKKKQVFH